MIIGNCYKYYSLPPQLQQLCIVFLQVMIIAGRAGSASNELANNRTAGRTLRMSNIYIIELSACETKCITHTHTHMHGFNYS